LVRITFHVKSQLFDLITLFFWRVNCTTLFCNRDGPKDSAIGMALRHGQETGSGRTMTNEQLKAEIARLTAANAELTAKSEARQHFTLKVSEKGAVSVYGLGRFPVTLYRGQWERLIANVDGIKSFIEANASRLAVKGAAAATPVATPVATPIEK